MPWFQDLIEGLANPKAEHGGRFNPFAFARGFTPRAKEERQAERTTGLSGLMAQDLENRGKASAAGSYLDTASSMATKPMTIIDTKGVVHVVHHPEQMKMVRDLINTQDAAQIGQERGYDFGQKKINDLGTTTINSATGEPQTYETRQKLQGEESNRFLQEHLRKLYPAQEQTASSQAALSGTQAKGAEQAFKEYGQANDLFGQKSGGVPLSQAGDYGKGQLSLGAGEAQKNQQATELIHALIGTPIGDLTPQQKQIAATVLGQGSPLGKYFSQREKSPAQAVHEQFMGTRGGQKAAPSQPSSSQEKGPISAPKLQYDSILPAREKNTSFKVPQEGRTMGTPEKKGRGALGAMTKGFRPYNLLGLPDPFNPKPNTNPPPDNTGTFRSPFPLSTAGGQTAPHATNLTSALSKLTGPNSFEQGNYSFKVPEEPQYMSTDIAPGGESAKTLLQQLRIQRPSLSLKDARQMVDQLLKRAREEEGY